MKIKIAGRLLTSILRYGGFDAITLPPFGIYIVAGKLDDHRLLRHEEAHWDQYKRHGFFNFYLLYFWYSLKYGYLDNPMEVEARSKERGK